MEKGMSVRRGQSGDEAQDWPDTEGQTQDFCVPPATASSGFLSLKRIPDGKQVTIRADICVEAECSLCLCAHLIYLKQTSFEKLTSHPLVSKWWCYVLMQ